MHTSKKLLLSLLALLCSGTVLADRAAEEAAIRKALSEHKLDSVSPAAIPGMYEVVVGTDVVYVSADGRYMMQGDLVDIQSRSNLTEPKRRDAQRAIMDSISNDKMIVYSPKETKYKVTVFTDIDCGYCRKLHKEIDQYLDEGIEVRYLMYPRAGRDSESYRKAVAVWCSKDRNASLTASKAGKAVEMKTCDNPIDEHMQLASRLGLRGTPLIVLQDGKIQPGYVPAKQLALLLQKSAATAH